VLREFHGYYVLRLVQCDGVPRYSNGGLYEGADETSFRGDFLKDCADVLGQDLLNDAWNSKMPEAASFGVNAAIQSRLISKNRLSVEGAHWPSQRCCASSGDTKRNASSPERGRWYRSLMPAFGT
jgi:hypothetical protein